MFPQVEFSLPLNLIIALILTAVIPLLVGLVTNSDWSPRAKALLHLVLSAVSGLLTEFAAALEANQPYDFGVGLLTALGIFLAGVLVHKALYATKGSSGNSVASHLAETGVKASDDRG